MIYKFREVFYKNCTWRYNSREVLYKISAWFYKNEKLRYKNTAWFYNAIKVDDEHTQLNIENHSCSDSGRACLPETDIFPLCCVIFYVRK